jgi:hypothetical protein
MAQALSTTIEHVRLRRARLEAPAARQRLSYLFSSAALRPTAMPPAAVLVVRCMSDPLPGRIAREIESAAAPSVEWENAAQARLEEMYRSAARPATGAVPSSAEAVLFADQGELLACLALDVDAYAANSWWWKSILRHRFPAQAGGWVEAWAEHPLYVPAAFEQLDGLGQAAKIVRRMSPWQAWRLLLAVGRAFGLPESAFVAGGSKMGARQEPETGISSSFKLLIGADAETAAAETRGQREADANRMGSAVPPPWEPYVAGRAVSEDLGVERRALLGVSLLLRSAPQLARSDALALRLRMWLESERAREGQSWSGNERPKDDAASSIRFVRFGADGGEPAAPVRLSGGSGEAAQPAQAESALRTAADGRGNAAPTEEQLSGSEDGFADSLAGSIVSDAAAGSQDANPSFQSTAEKSGEQARVQFENGCRTRLGGVFYLVHLLRQSMLLDFNVGFGGWALLELLARCLLNGVPIDVGSDPAWAVLAQLDGRAEGTHPGSRFEPLPVYEAPERWLRNLDSSMRYVRFRSGWVELWHPEGFLTLDSREELVPRSSLSDCARLNRRQRRAFGLAASVCPLGLTVTPELRRFLHFVLPYARWRLRQTTRNARVEEILLRDGTLYVTHSHVDLVMGMNQIGIAARVAGLDANPGWTPELGKVIQFHFVHKDFGHA